MSDLENKFKKSKIFFEFMNIWRGKNKESDIKNYLYSNEYKYAFFLWKKTEEKQEWIEALTIGGDENYDDLSSKVLEKLKTLEKLQIEFKVLNNKIREANSKITKIDENIKQMKPTIYFFSGMFTLSLTLVSAIAVKVNILNINNLEWWQIIVIISSVVAVIFIFAVCFYFLIWRYVKKYWKKLDS